MKIMIVSDTICPWCYVGKRRFERALAARQEIATEIEWRPFELNPQIPEEGLDRKVYMRAKFGGDERADEVYAGIRTAGLEENIKFAFDKISRVPNTVASHRLIAWSFPRGCQEQMVEELFQAYFLKGKDIGEIDVLVEAAGSIGFKKSEVRAYLVGGEGTEEIKSEAKDAKRLGISGVPCFVFNGKYAISGAQEIEVFSRVFDLALQSDEDMDAKP